MYYNLTIRKRQLGMKKYEVLCLIFVICCVFTQSLQSQNIKGKNSHALVIHGGAGNITRSQLSTDQEKAYHDTMQAILNEGYRMLGQGKSSEEVVVKVISMLEDSPLFNAGKGAAFTHTQENELDASIMNGLTGGAASVSGIKTIKNPIIAAQAVMNESDHVMLVGRGAEAFADSARLELVDPSYFKTESSLNALKKIQEKEATDQKWSDSKYGSVGAVALDKAGNICAGTSTGGMTNKKYGEISDASIIGASTYADNITCGISATGHGDYFIRNVVAYDISALMTYKESSLEDAAWEVVSNKLIKKGGAGGVIGLDKKGNITMTFNTKGMLRGYINKPYQPKTFIYKEK